MEEQLKNIIKDSVNFDISVEEIDISKPNIKEYGDFSTNVAMKLCKKLNKNPMELANFIKDSISDDIINKIDIVEPGFINFFVKKYYLFENLKKIIKLDSDYGKSDIGKNKKINLEFVSVNPTGLIHLGHARGACYGETLASILEYCNYDVTKEYYINDAGNQMNNMAFSIKERYKELCGLPFNMEENYYYGQEIINVAKNIYNNYGKNYLDLDIEKFKQIGLKTFLDTIKKDLQDISVTFDVWTSEQKLRDDKLVEQALNNLQEKGYTYSSDNAIWLKTSDFGDEKDRVIVKRDGNYTYFMPDIAYHLDKLNRGYDKLIDVLGADHHGYVSRLKAAVTMLGGDSNKLSVPLIQMVRAIKDGKEYKISKRTGKTITLSDLFNESGKDAIRYFFVSRSLDTQMDYDIDLATSKSNENPVYYVQYAHARICSILREKNYELENDYKFETISSSVAYNVLTKLYEWPKVVLKSALKQEPHLITNYVYELASLFHSYYGSEKIITDDDKYTKERIMFCKAVKITIANALNLIGVEARERM